MKRCFGIFFALLILFVGTVQVANAQNFQQCERSMGGISYTVRIGCNGHCHEYIVSSGVGARLYVEITQQRGFVNTVIEPWRSGVLRTPINNPGVSIRCAPW